MLDKRRVLFPNHANRLLPPGPWLKIPKTVDQHTWNLWETYEEKLHTGVYKGTIGWPKAIADMDWKEVIDKLSTTLENARTEIKVLIDREEEEIGRAHV